MKTVLAAILVLASFAVNAGERFSLSGFYIDSAIEYSTLKMGTWEEIPGPRDGYYVQSHDKYFENVIHHRNPWGSFTLGYDFPLFRRFDAYIEVGHRSSLVTNEDRGTEFGRVGIRIRPFAR